MAERTYAECTSKTSTSATITIYWSKSTAKQRMAAFSCTGGTCSPSSATYTQEEISEEYDREVTITGLSPNTSYTFTAGYGVYNTTSWSVSCTFKTNSPSPTKYYLSISADTGGTITGATSGYYSPGDTVPLKCSLSSGYSFSSWQINYGYGYQTLSTSQSYNYSMGSTNATIKATFSKATYYTLTCTHVNTSGIKLVNDTTYSIKSGTSFTSDELDNFALSITGHYNSGHSPSTVTLTSDKTVTFTYKPYTYSVKYYYGDATSGSAPADQTKTYGVNLTLQTNTGSLAKSNSSSSTPLTSIFNANGGSTSKGTQSSYKTVITSYTYSGWATTSGGAKVYDAGGSYTANSAASLYPSWSTGSTTSYSDITFPTATQCTRDDFNLAGWSTNSQATTADWAPGASYKPQTEETYYAVWNAISYNYKITYRPNGGLPNTAYDDKESGASTAKSKTFTADSCPYTKDKYTFIGWGDDDTYEKSSVVYSAGSKITLYSSSPTLTLYALWAHVRTDYSCIFNKNTTDTVTNMPSNLTEDGAVEETWTFDIRNVKTPIRSGYKFDGWYSTSACTGDKLSYVICTMTDNTRTVYAKWVKQYTVSLEVNPSDAGTVKGAGTYDENTEVTITATAKDGYKFKGWYNLLTPISTDSTYKFTIKSNVSYIAKFKKTPGLFKWTNTISSGQPSTNLTANDWLRIQTFIDTVYQTPFDDWIRASSTGTLTAEMFNQVRDRIAALPGCGAIVGQKSKGDNVLASYFDGDGSTSDSSLRAALNRAIGSI